MSDRKLQAEIEDLRRRLEEAEETIHAIRSGAVDALVFDEANGPRIYTLETADRPYRLLVEQMQQGAATLQADGTIVYCNVRLAQLLEVPHERLIGAALHDFVAPADRAAYDNLLGQGRNRSGQGEARLQRADGALVPAYLTFNPLPKDCGADIGVLVTDLTSQRHHEQLAAAHEALADAARRKDEFLATLAHELRNPLAPIQNAVQILRLAGGKPQAVLPATDMLERQVRQMVHLVDDLLDVGRINLGKIELRREPVALASIVDQAVEAVRPLARSLHHDLRVTLPPEPITVDGDLTRLAQVVGNLLSNACKFTDNGGLIRLSVEREDEKAVIRVRDNGIGIAADELARIFDMFAQVDSSLERVQSGLGIGLTLVKKLAEMHGGTVEVESAGVGQGSEFVVRLPALAETAERLRSELAASKSKFIPSRRILVVDDNRDAADSLAALLKLEGHETQLAHDGVEAVAAAATFKPDLVLLDIGLPKLNGYEAARKIREQPSGKHMMLVAVTGWGQEEDRRRSHSAGFDLHMVKPVDYPALMRLLAAMPPGRSIG